jgi:2,3,4,5-tetrahydropyridine-2-carboxylate N-succinyltransferase
MLQQTIEKIWDNRELLQNSENQEIIRSVINQLDLGELRVAEPTANGWQVNEWVFYKLNL